MDPKKPDPVSTQTSTTDEKTAVPLPPIPAPSVPSPAGAPTAPQESVSLAENQMGLKPNNIVPAPELPSFPVGTISAQPVVPQETVGQEPANIPSSLAIAKPASAPVILPGTNESASSTPPASMPVVNEPALPTSPQAPDHTLEIANLKDELAELKTQINSIQQSSVGLVKKEELTELSGKIQQLESLLEDKASKSDLKAMKEEVATSVKNLLDNLTEHWSNDIKDLEKTLSKQIAYINPPTPAPKKGGIPWWVWLLALLIPALFVAGILIATRNPSTATVQTNAPAITPNILAPEAQAKIAEAMQMANEMKVRAELAEKKASTATIPPPPPGFELVSSNGARAVVQPQSVPQVLINGNVSVESGSAFNIGNGTAVVTAPLKETVQTPSRTPVQRGTSAHQTPPSPQIQTAPQQASPQPQVQMAPPQMNWAPWAQAPQYPVIQMEMVVPFNPYGSPIGGCYQYPPPR